MIQIDDELRERIDDIREAYADNNTKAGQIAAYLHEERVSKTTLRKPLKLE
jgi:hypothetical protein